MTIHVIFASLSLAPGLTVSRGAKLSHDETQPRSSSPCSTASNGRRRPPRVIAPTASAGLIRHVVMRIGPSEKNSCLAEMDLRAIGEVHATHRGSLSVAD